MRNRAGANLVDPSASYASQLQGLAQANGLKFQLNYEQRPTEETNFKDVTGNATLTCSGAYCPSVTRTTDSFGTFRSSNWYAATGANLAFSQPKFSLGGWVTVRDAFGGEYDERILLGPDNVGGAVDKYIQLSVVNLSSTPRLKVHFTATDGSQCEQVLTELTLAKEQKTHVFVTYDGTQVRGYKNGFEVGSYTLQGCANKVPAGNRFTIGRGASQATLYIHNVYFNVIDEGSGWSSAEAYLQLDGSKEPIWKKTGVENGDTPDVGVKRTLRDSSVGDSNNTVYICEEDRGTKEGKCQSDSFADSDDYQGDVSIDPRTNGYRDIGWSHSSYRGNLRYNVQNNFFNGDLDDLRIYESTLSAREINQIANGSGLVYQLDEASGRPQFRNAGTDTTQLYCQNAGNCPISGIKGYSGQAIRFDGVANQNLAIDNLRQRFGSNFVVSFWFKPEQNRPSSGPLPLLRSGQDSEGYTLYATNNGTTTGLNSRFNFSQTGYGTIGGSGGNRYDLRCSADEALVGIYGGAGAVVDRVGALCVALNANGSWNSEPRTIGTAGGGGGSGYDQRCPRNQVVVAFEGRSGALVDQITLKCAALNSDGTAQTSIALHCQPWVDMAALPRVNESVPRICQRAGSTGRAGGLVDAFGITCRDQFISQNRNLIRQWAMVAYRPGAKWRDLAALCQRPIAAYDLVWCALTATVSGQQW